MGQNIEKDIEKYDFLLNLLLYIIIFYYLYSIQNYLLEHSVYKWIKDLALYPTLSFLFDEINTLIFEISRVFILLITNFCVFKILVRKKSYFSRNTLFAPIKLKVFVVYCFVMILIVILHQIATLPYSYYIIRTIGGRSIITIGIDGITNLITNLVNSVNPYKIIVHENGTLETNAFILFFFVVLAYVIAVLHTFMAALVEELLNRGPMLLYMCDQIGPRSSILFASIVFALMHVSHNNQIFFITVYMRCIAISILFAYCYIKTKNIIFTTSLHFLWNFVATFLGNKGANLILIKKLSIPSGMVLFMNLYYVLLIFFVIILFFVVIRYLGFDF